LLAAAAWAAAAAFAWSPEADAWLWAAAKEDEDGNHDHSGHHGVALEAWAAAFASAVACCRWRVATAQNKPRKRRGANEIQRFAQEYVINR